MARADGTDKPKKAFKDQLDLAFLERLTRTVQAASTTFRGDEFLSTTLASPWPELELKARIAHVAEHLHEHLDGAYVEQLRVLEIAAPAFEGLTSLVFPAFVERFGLEHWEDSLRALELFTPLCSSEFAVRPFLIQDQPRMIDHMRRWCNHSEASVRRLASEGCRPRLPWAVSLPELKRDPAPIVPILEALRDDPSEYVRRSVSNNLNDISKDHPQLVRALARAWMASPSGDVNVARARLVKHACRTLLRKGDEELLELFGFRAPDHIQLCDLVLDPVELCIGDELEFRFTLRSKGELGQVRLEYAVDYVTSRAATSRKVFQLSSFRSTANRREVRRRHSFKDLSTRRHRPGEHQVHVIVNGRILGSSAFQVAATK